jgi:hypothetical protein
VRNYIVRSLLPAGLLAAPALVGAQDRVPTVAHLTPYAGYVSFGDFADGPLGTRLTSSGAALYGVQLGLDVVPGVSLVGNLGYASSNLRIGAPLVGGYDIAPANALLYDGGLQFHLPTLGDASAGIRPYAEVGIGGMRYQVQRGPLTATSTNFVTSVGGGMDLQMSRTVGLRLMLKDYIGRFDFREATGLDLTGNLAHNLVYGVGVNLGF